MTTNHRQLQEVIDGAIASGEFLEAYGGLRRLWAEQPGPASAAYVLAQGKRLLEHVPAVPKRVAILRSFTVEPLVPMFRAEAFVAGVHAEVYVGEFNAYPMDILGPKDSLYAFDPDIVFLAVQTRDVAPELWSWEDPERGQAAVDRVISEFRSLLGTFRSRHRASVVVHDFEQPAQTRQGLLDEQSTTGQAAAIRQLNDRLRQMAAQLNGVYVLGYDALMAAHGRLRWFDQRKWLMARLPLSAEAMRWLGSEWSRFVCCLAGRSSKVVVTDLDNTLWGGVVGEDGPAGIHLGADYAGAGFRELQHALLACYDRGIMLAIASKNNEADALEVLDTHPDMILKRKHFASVRINWNHKTQSIREIAEELNVGIDSILFLDDNPSEREIVRRELPFVTVLELPGDPLAYANAVRNHPALQRLTLSAEDRERNRYYVEQKARDELSQSTQTIEDFYRALDQVVEIQPANRGTISRIAQLTQKTNQFNLTTKRYSEQEIETLANSADWGVHSANVRDRFGDNGIVALAITHRNGKNLEIDTFLLSCRVIARTVETAILAFLADEAKAAGCNMLRGWFCPTKKNQPAAEFFLKHGFSRVGKTENKEEWVLDLNSQDVRCPEWIRLLVKEHQDSVCSAA